MLDRRCKHKFRETQRFYIYVKYLRSGIFYVKYKDGKCISTGERDLRKAYEFAVAFQNSRRGRKKKDFTKRPKVKVIEIIRSYYRKDSPYLIYDKNHGYDIPEMTRKTANTRMNMLADKLSDVTSFKELSRKRLIQLQEQLLSDGYSGKTVNNIFSMLHKIFLQLVDKEMIPSDPMAGLKPCSYTKSKRLCFPMEKLKGYFSKIDSRCKAVSYVAITTGMRRNELQDVKASDIMIRNDRLYLHVPGTKTENAERTIPINRKCMDSLLYIWKQKPFNRNEAMDIVAQLAEEINYPNWKDDGIVFHSFRKTYKTLLTQYNINSDIIEFFIGHATPNYMSNDVNRTYLVLERADMQEVCEKIRKCFEYFG